jgi:hypothetical protein
LEFALLPNSKIVCPKKGIISPIYIERPLALKVYSVLCSKFIISQLCWYVNMFCKKISNAICTKSKRVSNTRGLCGENGNRKRNKSGAFLIQKTRGEILHSPLINITISFSVIPKSTANKGKKVPLSTKLCESRLMRGDCVEKFSFFCPKGMPYLVKPKKSEGE